MVQFRDIILKQQANADKKQDRRPIQRAVLTDDGGEQTSVDPLSDVWANQDDKRVWFMTDGATQPGQILCRQISDPYVGLGVNIGYVDDNNEPEVLRDDFFLTKTGDPTAWASTAPRDNEPGGRKLLWLYSKSLIPLAVYPSDVTGLNVNIAAGDYPYAGARVSFGGLSNLALTQNPNPGQHYLAGIYLDASNAVQVVYGTSISTAYTAPQPTWPAGAFQLATILIDDVQTSIDFDTDISDRRLLWSNEIGGGGGWEFNTLLLVNSGGSTEYATIALAFAAAASGDTVLVGVGTFTCDDETLPAGVNLVGVDKDHSILATSADLICLTAGGSNYIAELTTQCNTSSASNTIALQANSDNVEMFNILADCQNAGGGDGTALSTNGDSIKANSSEFTGSAYGVFAAGGVGDDVNFYNCILDGGSFDLLLSGANVTFAGTLNQLKNGTVTGSATRQGHYLDGSGNFWTFNGTGFNSGAWLIDESATLRKKYADLAAAVTAAASSGDTIKLDTDTYSIAARQDIGKSLVIEGDGPEATILDFSVSNDTCFDFTADNITVVFRNLTVDHSAGGSTAAGPLFTNNAGVKVILDNAIVKKSGGAPTMGYGAWWLAGTLELRNGSKLLCTSGTSKYGVLNDSSGDVTVIIGSGCEVGGATADVYSNRAGSTVNIYGGILTNSLINWAGTINAAAYTAAAALLMDDDNWIGLGSSAGRLAFNDTTVDELQVKSANLIIEDDKIIGLGPAAGRIEFDDQSTDEINFIDCVVGIGTSAPSASYKLDVNGAMAVTQIVRSRATLADDTATSFSAIPIGNRFIYGIVVNDGSYFWGVCTYNGNTSFNNSGFSIVAGAGTLTGTTGPDGTMNVRDNAGVLYVENRRGGSRTFGIVYIASD